MSVTLRSARYLPLVLLFCGLCTLHSEAISCPSPHIQSLLMTGNAPPANIVLGQSSFTSSSPGSSLHALSLPMGVAVSPASGKVFISDNLNNRILRFAPPVLGQMGGTAEAVFGSTALVAGCQPDQLHYPWGIFVDSRDALWVADNENHRVLRFDNSSYVESGPSASLVLGQTNLVTCSDVPSPRDRYPLYPTGVWVEPDDTLWVVDRFNSRVLRFDYAHSKKNGDPADGVLGISAMKQPSSLVVSKSGDLYVSDVEWPRVIRYKGAKYISSRVAPDGLWGQSTYEDQSSVVTVNGLQNPMGIGLDDCNNLFIGDMAASRVTMYPNADGATAFPNATLVFGQLDFTSYDSPIPPTAASLIDVVSIFYDSKNLTLWVVDYVNHRVLGWAYDGKGGSTTSSSSTTSSGTTAGTTTSSNHIAEDGAATLENFVTYLQNIFQYFK